MLAMPPEQRTESVHSRAVRRPQQAARPSAGPRRSPRSCAGTRLDYAADALLGSARALVAEYTRPGPGSLWHDAARVTAPTLVIHGSHDRLVNPAMAGRAARTFRNGRAVVLPRIGHVAMMERPDLVAAEMREFLHGIVRDKVAQPGLARTAAEPSSALGQRPTRSRGQSWPRPAPSQAGPLAVRCAWLGARASGRAEPVSR